MLLKCSKLFHLTLIYTLCIECLCIYLHKIVIIRRALASILEILVILHLKEVFKRKYIALKCQLQTWASDRDWLLIAICHFKIYHAKATYIWTITNQIALQHVQEWHDSIIWNLDPFCTLHDRTWQESSGYCSSTHMPSKFWQRHMLGPWPWYIYVIKSLAQIKWHDALSHILNTTPGYGTLGTGNTNDLYEPPTTPIDLGDDFIPNAINCGVNHCCCISTDKTLKCWGQTCLLFIWLTAIGKLKIISFSKLYCMIQVKITTDSWVWVIPTTEETRRAKWEIIYRSSIWDRISMLNKCHAAGSILVLYQPIMKSNVLDEMMLVRFLSK